METFHHTGLACRLPDCGQPPHPRALARSQRSPGGIRKRSNPPIRPGRPLKISLAGDSRFRPRKRVTPACARPKLVLSRPGGRTRGELFQLRRLVACGHRQQLGSP